LPTSGEQLKSEAEEEELDMQEVEEAPSEVSDMSLEVVTPLYPTEDENAVRKAILNLFPLVGFDEGEGSVRGNASSPVSMARLRRRLREMRIRDTARSVLGSGVGSGSVTFALNKQSAFARIPNFSTGGAPLGDLTVTVSCGNPQAVVAWLCELDTE
jgi:predicted RNA binding protein with dsRBD fold (UPF0201 family)